MCYNNYKILKQYQNKKLDNCFELIKHSKNTHFSILLSVYTLTKYYDVIFFRKKMR